MMTDKLVELGAVMIIAALMLGLEHYMTPLRVIVCKHPTVNYVLGMLGILLPLTGLMAMWGSWWELAALWAVTISGGGMVLVAYLVDMAFHEKARADIAEIEGQVLRNGATED